MTKQECAVLVGIIASAYPAWKPTEETVTVYVELLSDLNHNEAHNAVRSLLMASEYPPSVAAIRKKVLEGQNGLPLSKNDAWQAVMSEVNTKSVYHPYSFTDPVVAEVVKAIGYRNICTSTNLDTIRAQFFRLYEEQAEKYLEEKLSSISFQNQLEGNRAKEIEA